ncbi:MAG: radical SAM protein [Nanoarchaeota archaeon]
MNILFLYPTTPPKIFPPSFSQGIGYLSSSLKSVGHKTDLYLCWEYNEDDIKKKLKEFKPDIIAANAVSDQFILAQKLIEYFVKKAEIPVVLGGVHSIIAPESAIKTEGILGICVGEAEESFVEFCNKYEKGDDWTKVRNFWFKIKKDDKEEIIRNPMRAFLQDLDTLPFPDRELFEPYLDFSNELAFMTSRGCPYECTYCINHTLMKIQKDLGKFVRYRSIPNVMKEIKYAVDRYKPKRLIFDDDTFTLNPKHVREFADAYSKEVKLPFVCNIRVETVNEGVFADLKRAGCTEVKAGIESGNEKLRIDILKRRMANEQIELAFKLAHKYGIQASAFNMIGLPTETEEMIWDTIKLNRKINPHRISATIFNPYPNTESYEFCKERGWISDRKVSSYWENETMLDQPSISREKVRMYQKIFFGAVYYPHLTWLWKLLYILRLRGDYRALDAMKDAKKWIASKLTQHQIDILMRYVKPI